MSTYNLLVNQTATVATPPLPVQPIAQGAGLGQPAQAVAITATVAGTGAQTATVQPVVSNDGVNWSNFGSAISLSGNPSATGNVAPVQAPFTYWGAIVTALTGTGATVNCKLSA